MQSFIASPSFPERVRVFAFLCERSNGKKKGRRDLRVFERGKVLYVAIIETMSVIKLRIEKERQYKQSPYVTT